MRVLIALLICASVAHAEPRGGFTFAAGGGTNVGTPFAELQVGRRFVRAPFLELFLDASYGAAISEVPFMTLGAGIRTYFLRRGRVELFHQALAAFAISGSGNVNDRAIGERLLGAFMTQGVGISVELCRCWSVSLAVSTGYPVWLRPELAARYTW